MNGDYRYVGFSDRIYDPAIQRALEKNKKSTFIFFIILLIAPIAISLVIGMKKGDMDTILGGVFVSAIVLIVNIFSRINQKMKKQWDGEVVKKYKENVYEDGDSNTTETNYVVELRTTDGKKKKISGKINLYYNYLNVGDRVRYYPQFNNYYEKYDKSGDSYVFCPVCMTKNNINDDYCKRCKVPVIK